MSLHLKHQNHTSSKSPLRDSVAQNLSEKWRAILGSLHFQSTFNGFQTHENLPLLSQNVDCQAPPRGQPIFHDLSLAIVAINYPEEQYMKRFWLENTTLLWENRLRALDSPCQSLFQVHPQNESFVFICHMCLR